MATLRGQDRSNTCLEEMMDRAIQRRASDLHFAIDRPPILRVNQRLERQGDVPDLDNYQLQVIAGFLLLDGFHGGYRIPSAGGDRPIPGWQADHDLAVEYGGWRWRANVHQQRGTPSISLRLIPSQPPRLSDLGLPQAMERLGQLRQGLVLVCGPTSSGKTSTLAALVEQINTSRAERIITLEDPIEYIYQDKLANIIQREIGPIEKDNLTIPGDTVSFERGLKSALRMDPNIILIGEMRDPVTVQTALSAAESGHLVFSTLHSRDVVGTIGRVIGFFSESQKSEVRYQLSTVLRGVACQALVPSVDGARPAAVVELMLPNEQCGQMIREKREAELPNMLETDRTGMQAFDQALAFQVAAGRVDAEEARAWTHNEGRFRTWLPRLQEFLDARRTAA